MTSNTSSTQWPRSANSAFFRPPSRAALSASKQTPRSCPRQSLSQPNAISTTSSNAAEPPVKRQKVDNEPCKSRSEAHVKFAAANDLYARNTSAQQASDDRSAKGVPGQTSLVSSQDKNQILRSGSPLLPLRPSRKLTNGGRSGIRPSAIQRVTSRGNVQNKPYVFEAPPSAPHFRDDGPADFHPWTGHHLEDILNEPTTKNGSYDKPHISQSETSTAKHAVWSSLKHKSGIQVLSSLFVSALDQRQAHGVVTANCTFKPPPRVTLTDTKREVWLRDLANPDIPLRRLSRTIPHGIRGKVLLDQCLAKEIPTSRAVWLAKCVGANEIRAFKRKGAGGAFAVGGESKWIKDWTSNVEQFVETLIGTCSSPGWRSSINYGLRLASHLSSDHLLDQDHYLDWILSSLQHCGLDTLPIWMLVMQIHLQEILQQRQRGRRLVEALVEQLHKTTEISKSEVYDSVIQQVVQMLKSFMISHSSLFLMPRLWHLCDPILRNYIGPDEPALHECFGRISKRNLRLLTTVSHEPVWRAPDTPRQRVISVLDSVSVDNNFPLLASDCLGKMEDVDSLVAVCLEWGSSLYRNGEENIYICARLLRQYSKGRNGLDMSIMSFLAAKPRLEGLSIAKLFRILTELLRSKHLAPGRYVSWIMDRGNLREPLMADQNGHWDARLLQEMPLQGVPPHVLNLRRILLSRVGASVNAEDDAINSLKTQISGRVPDLLSPSEGGTTLTTLFHDTTQLSVTIRSAIAIWVRQSVAACFRPSHTEAELDPGVVPRQETVTCRSTTNSMSLCQFREVRKILEELKDFSILADVLHIVSNSADCSVLAAVCESISYHFRIFAAMGAHASLFNDLYQRYEDLRHSKIIDVILLESLIDLGRCISNAEKEVKRIEQQALLYHQNSTVIACSPISESMAEAVHSAESHSAEDIEQVLASGTSMDKQTLAQLFEAIIKRMEASWTDSTSNMASYAELLIRLRGFGRKDYDSLIHGWVGHVLRNPARPALGEIFVPLICSACLMLKKLLELAVSVLDESSQHDPRAVLSVEMLEMLATMSADEALTTHQSGYRVRLQYGQAVRRRPGSTLPFLQATFQACSDTGSEMHSRACALSRRSELRVLVNDLAVYDPKALIELGRSVGLEAILIESQATFQDEGGSYQDTERQLTHILVQANNFNAPFCRLKLEAVLAEAVGRSANPAMTLVTALQKASPLNATSRSLLPNLVAVLPPSQATQIRRHVQSEILSRLLCDETPPDGTARELVDPLLLVMEANADKNADQMMFPAVAQVGEGLNSILSSQHSMLNQSDYGYLEVAGDSAHSSPNDFYETNVLLRLLTVHQSTMQHPKFPQATLCLVLLSLSVFLIHPSWSKQHNLTDYIHDVLNILSDFLSDESRTQCMSTLRDYYHTRDPRLRSIFDSSETTEDEWLQLVTDAPARPESKAPDIAGAVFKPATQPFYLRRWEMMQDATPLMGENDASLNLTLFGARRSVL